MFDAIQPVCGWSLWNVKPYILTWEKKIKMFQNIKLLFHHSLILLIGYVKSKSSTTLTLNVDWLLSSWYMYQHKNYSYFTKILFWNVGLPDLADRLNSAGPDQTTSKEAIWSGSTLFA